MSHLRDWVFGEDLRNPFGRFVRRCLWRHPAADDVYPGSAPYVFASDLGIGRIVHPERRCGWSEQTLFDECLAMRIGNPPRVLFDNRTHRWQVASKSCLQILIENVGLD